MPTIPLDEQLRDAQVAIENALANADIKQHLAEYGYDVDQLQEGRALYDQALALHQK